MKREKGLMGSHAWGSRKRDRGEWERAGVRERVRAELDAIVKGVGQERGPPGQA